MQESERALKISRRGIYYDLSISPYVYDTGVYQFVFSSKYNYERFQLYKKTPVPITAFHAPVKGITGIQVDITAMRDINEYVRIEKRGFLVYSYKYNLWHDDPGEMKFAALEV